LLSFIDIYCGLAALSVLVLCLIIFAYPKNGSPPLGPDFHL
jgi:hypothetical protein